MSKSEGKRLEASPTENWKQIVGTHEIPPCPDPYLLPSVPQGTVEVPPDSWLPWCDLLRVKSRGLLAPSLLPAWTQYQKHQSQDLR